MTCPTSAGCVWRGAPVACRPMLPLAAATPNGCLAAAVALYNLQMSGHCGRICAARMDARRPPRPAHRLTVSPCGLTTGAVKHRDGICVFSGEDEQEPDDMADVTFTVGNYLRN
jgi:hypothetical protein